MLNQIVLVGRLVKMPEVFTTESGKRMTYLTLAIPRTFKNSAGEYDTDFIDCVLWANVAETTTEYCHKGDLLGVKGRIQTRKIENEEEKPKHVTEIIGERVTFLSSGHKTQTIEKED